MRKKTIILLIILSAFLILMAGLFILLEITTMPIVALGRSALGGKNDFSVSNPAHRRHENGLLFISDISYGNEYPNSSLDFYVADDNLTELKPVFIYIHGGGYIWGDKYSGDPFSENGEATSLSSYFQPFLDAGFRVVSLNYALAPEYPYPIPVYQVNQAMEFLQRHSEDFGIDMTSVIFGGTSAGGHLAGQYVNIQTNKDYADKMNMPQTLDSGSIRAVIFSSALLVPSLFDKTGSWFDDYIYRLCGRSYFNQRNFHNSPQAQEADVTVNITGHFPPVFISDGNKGTFTKQAEDLAIELNGFGIPYKLVLFNKNEVILRHGFELDMTNQYAVSVSKQAIEFLRDKLVR
jgi:acetyl esterase/lipase